VVPEYLHLSDFLSIAEGVTGMSGDVLLDNDEVVARALSGLHAPFARAEDGREWFSDIRVKAAILEFSVIRARPLPRLNIETAHECMKSMLLRNGFYFDRSRSTVDPVDLWSRIVQGDGGALGDLLRWVYECT
jgi:hypothetical protein